MYADRRGHTRLRQLHGMQRAAPAGLCAVPLYSTQYTIHTHHRGCLRPCQPACTQYLSDTGNTAPRDREPGALPLERACSSPSRLPFRPCPRSERLLASAHIHSLLLLRAQGSVDPGMWPSKHQNQGGGAVPGTCSQHEDGERASPGTARTLFFFPIAACSNQVT